MSNKWRFVRLPVIVVAASIFLIWISDAWHFAKWMPPAFGKQIGKSALGINCFGYIQDTNDKINEFVAMHPDNPEYHFGWALMCGKDEEIDVFAHLHKAEELDPTNPIYSYWLGLAYSYALSGFRIRLIPDISPDSAALAAFDRAEKLEPNNAAIDLARLNVLIKDDETPTSYRQRRGQDFSTHGSVLTPEGREVMCSAMNKTEYRSHGTEAISIGLKLLKDSGQNTFFSRVMFLASAPIQRYLSESKGVKLFIDDIGPFSNREDAEAVADTIIDLMHLGLMMRNDPDRTLIQHMIGNILTRIAADLLGDLYLVNEMPSSERLVGEMMAESYNWRAMWQTTNQSRITLFGFTPIHLVNLFIAAIVQLLYIGLFLLFIIGLICTLIGGIPAERLHLTKTRLWTAFAVIISALFSVIVSAFVIEKGAVAAIAFSSVITMLGIVFLIIRFFEKRKGNRLSFALPIYLIIVGSLGILTAALNLQLMPISIPIAVVLGAMYATFRNENRMSIFWSLLLKLSAETVVVFTVILIICWMLSGSQLSSFMNMKEINVMTNITGPNARMPEINEYDFSAHYIRNDGTYEYNRVERLKRLEELFGRSFESKPSEITE